MRRFAKTAILLHLLVALPASGAAPSRPAKEAWRSQKGVYAVLLTSAGTMVCELFPAQAPRTVENFIGLAEGTKEYTDPVTKRKIKKHLYDGTIFHRVVKDFMIQGGDPLGTGHGGIGYVFEDETSSGLKFDRPGRLAMSHPSGRRDMNGSQFFITEGAAPWLDNMHTIFGQLVEGDEVLKRIASGPVKGGFGEDKDRPLAPVVLKKVEIVRVGVKPTGTPE